jgi:anti-anti-sigma factor
MTVTGGSAYVRMPVVFDSQSASEFRQLLTAPRDGCRELVLDCSDTELIQLCAVSLLVALRRRCASRAIELKMTRLSPATREFLVMTGLHRIIASETACNELGTAVPITRSRVA